MTLNTLEITSPESTDREQILNRRYRILRELGRGGMGVVYLVEDKSRENEKIVLKVLQSQIVSEESIQGLRKEFLTLATLSHPNLVRVYDFGRSTELNKYYYTMEFIDGKEFVDAAGTLSLDEIIALFFQSLQVLAYTHDAGIFHGDIKSENILVTGFGSDSLSIKIMDFGLAGVQDEKGHDNIGGTLLYLAPERLRGAPMSAQTDLYALGVLMYWALSGEPPFNGSPEEIKRAHLTKMPRPIAKIKPDIPRWISDIVSRLLAKDPFERYQSCEDVLDALSSTFGGNIDLGDTIPPMIWRSFRTLKAKEISSLYDNIVQSLRKDAQEESTPNFIIINGNEGTGHDQIIDELKHKLQIKDFDVYEGFCRPGLHAAYRPVVEAFSGHDQISQGLQKAIDSYQAALTSQSIEAEANHKDPELLRHTLHEKIANTIRNACRKQPLVLVLRNLEFADEATIELVFYLSRILNEERIAFLTYITRDNLSDSAHKLIKQKQDSLPAHRELNVSSLTEEELVVLLKAAFKSIEAPTRFYRELHSQSGGVTEIVAATMADLNRQGMFLRSEAAWVLSDDYDLTKIVPQNVSELYQKVVETLSSLQKRVIWTIAAYGAINKNLLFKLLRTASDDVHYSVDLLVQKRILVSYEADHSRIYDFQSAGFREAIYSEIPSQERVKIHRQIVSIFEDDTGIQISVVQKAFHYLHAGYVEMGLAYASKAYRKLKQVYSLRQALDIANLALSAARQHSTRFYRTFLRRIAQIEDILGNVEEALKRFNEAADLYRNGVPKAIILRHIAALYQKVGDIEKSRKVLGQALQQLPPGAGIEKALIIREESWLALMEGQIPKAIELGEKALAALNQRQVTKALALTLNSLGAAHYFASDMETAIQYFRKSAEIKAKLGDKRGLATTLSNLAVMYNISGDSNRAMDEWQKALKIREEIGDIAGLAETHNNIGIFLYERGDYARAFTFYRKSKELNMRIGNIKGLVEVHDNLGELECTREDFASALEILEKGLLYADRINYLNIKADMYYHLARAYQALNQKELFRKNIDQCLQLAEEHSQKNRLGVYYILKHYERVLAGFPEDDTYLRKAKAVYKEEKDPILEVEIEIAQIRSDLTRGPNEDSLYDLQNLLEKVESAKYKWYELQVLILIGQTMMALNRLNPKLETVLNSADESAEKMGLYLKVRDVNLLKGRFYRRANRLNHAYQAYRKAYKYLKALLISLKEDAHKVSLLQSPENVALAKEIKSLQAQINKKNRSNGGLDGYSG